MASDSAGSDISVPSPRSRKELLHVLENYPVNDDDMIDVAAFPAAISPRRTRSVKSSNMQEAVERGRIEEETSELSF